MNNITKTLILIFIFLITFIISFPKDKIYYYSLSKLKEHNIAINSLKKDIGLMNIDLQNNIIYLSNASIARASSIDIGLLSIDVNNVNFQGSFTSLVPKIDHIKIWYSLGKFLEVKGKFGNIIAKTDIFNKKIIFTANIDQNTYNKYRNIFKKFKKSKEGYKYELSF